MEHTITNTPWNDNDMYAEESERDALAIAAELEATRQRDMISRACKHLGWTNFQRGGFDAPNFDWHVDLSGDSGYVWSLKQFSDSDNAEGVATAHWVDALDMDGNNAEGDTLEEFERALRFLDKPAIRQGKRYSRFPADWNVDHEAATKPQQDAADEADRQYHADAEEGF